MAVKGRSGRDVSSGRTIAGVGELQKALAAARRKLESAEARKARAVNRATAELRSENDMLEAQLTRVVQEIGQLRFVVDRVTQLEREVRVKDLRIGQLEAEVERLQAALASARPTAMAPALDSRAARGLGSRPRSRAKSAGS